MLLAKVYDHIKTTVTYQYTVAKMSYVLGLLAGVRPKDFILMTDEDKIFYVHKPLFDYTNQLLDEESKNTLKPLSDSSLPIEYTVSDINLSKLNSFSLLDVESKHATLFIIEDGDGNYVVKGYVNPWYVTPLTAEDFLSLHFIKPFSDQIISSDVPYKNNQKPLSDYLTFTDYSILNYTINYNDYVNVSEYEIKHFNKVNLDDVQLLDTNPIFVNSKILSDEQILSETVYKNTNLIYSDSIISSEIPYKHISLAIFEDGDGNYVVKGYVDPWYVTPLTVEDQLNINFKKYNVDFYTSTDNQTKNFIKFLIETSISTDQENKVITKSVEEENKIYVLDNDQIHFIGNKTDSIPSIDYLNPFIINKTIVEPVLINESIRILLIKSPIYDTQSITDTPYKNPLLKIIETGDGTYVEIGYFETGYISPLTAYDSTPQLSIT